MYRVFQEGSFGELTKKFNALVRNNPEFNCKIVNFGTGNGGWNLSTFVLTKVKPGEEAKKVGEYRVICSSDGKNFEQELNEVKPEEGWVLVKFASNLPAAVFCRDEEHAAAAQGMTYGSDYRVFKASGCENRQIYENYQKQIAGHVARLEETRRDAEEAFNLGRHGEYIRLAFLAIEQAILSLYAIFRHSETLEKSAPPTHLLEGLCNVYQVQLIDPKEFAKYRDLRNQVVHENKKIDIKTAQQARAFFEETLSQIQKLISTTPYDLERRVNHGGFDATLKAQIDLSGFKLLKGHEEEIADLGKADRQTADNDDDDDY